MGKASGRSGDVVRSCREGDDSLREGADSVSRRDRGDADGPEIVSDRGRGKYATGGTIKPPSVGSLPILESESVGCCFNPFTGRS